MAPDPGSEPEAEEVRRLRGQIERQIERAVAAEQGRVEAACRNAEAARAWRRIERVFADVERDAAYSALERARAQTELAALRSRIVSSRPKTKYIPAAPVADVGASGPSMYGVP